LFDFLFEALGVLVVVLFLFGPMVLSAMAFARTRHLRELVNRIAKLEELLSPSAPVSVSAVAESPQVETPPPQVRPATSEREAEILLTPVSRPAPSGLAAIDWEALIGRKGLGWVAVVLIIFAAGFFLKYALENHWIGPLGRVMLAALAGGALVVGGQRARRRGWSIYFQMLTSAGVVLFYLAAYAAFGFYHLLPREAASLFLLLIVAESAVLAVLANAPALGLMAILGGLLTPLLLTSEKDQYVSLFLYLVALDVGAILMVTLRRWPAVGTVALLGTHALFWGWYSENFHPEKRHWALGFQVAVYVLFLTHGLVSRLIRRCEADWEDLSRWLLNATLGFVAFYALLKPDYEPWLGTLAMTMAVLYAALARWMLGALPNENRLFLTTLAIAVGFVAVAFPIQAKASWIALGWAAEAAALWWFGVRVRTPMLRLAAVVLLGMAVFRLIFVDTSYHVRAPYWPILNDHALPALGVAACWLGALAATRRRLSAFPATEQTLAAVAEIGGVLLVWFVLSVDVRGAFGARAVFDGANAERWRRLGQMSLSVVWTVYAAVVLAVGFVVQRPRLRWTALALFGLVVAKVFLVDMAGLNEFYRIVAFLVAAIVLGVAAGVYQRLRPESAETARGKSQTDATG
jgi:uncharacterized membrane protein